METAAAGLRANLAAKPCRWEAGRRTVFLTAALVMSAPSG